MKKLLALVVAAGVLSLFGGGCSPKVQYETDTLYLKDTIIKTDTIIVKDTINDTLIVEDTIIVKDTIGKYYEYITFHTFLPETLLLFNEYHLDYEIDSVDFYDDNSLKVGFIRPHGWIISNCNKNYIWEETFYSSKINLTDLNKTVSIYEGKFVNGSRQRFPIVVYDKDMKISFYILRDRDGIIIDSSLDLSKKVKTFINPLEVKEVYKDDKVYKALLGIKDKYIDFWKDSYFVDGLYKPSKEGYTAPGRNYVGTLYGYATDSNGNKVRWDGISNRDGNNNYYDTLRINTPEKYLSSEFRLSEVFIEFVYTGGQDKDGILFAAETAYPFRVQGTTDTLKVQW